MKTPRSSRKTATTSAQPAAPVPAARKRKVAASKAKAAAEKSVAANSRAAAQKSASPGKAKPTRTRKTTPSKRVPAKARIRSASVNATTGLSVNQDVLDQARMQWQFGDWESLIQLDDAGLPQTGGREKLALLIGCAYQQLDDTANARRLIKQAIAWGCERRLVSQLLVAGVYNTLGRAAALAREENKALACFKDAVQGVAGDQRLACQARSVREVARLGLFQQAIDYVEKQSTLLPGQSAGNAALRHAPVVDGRIQSQLTLLRQSIANQPSRHQATVALPAIDHARAPAANKNAIVIAGMRHAGSTALFNAVKIALEMKQIRFVSFYSEGKDKEALDSPDAPLLLIKTHEFRDDIVDRANLVITTRRDLRDSVASAKRRDFPILQKFGSAVEYAKYNRSLHDMWLPHSHCEFVYEAFMQDPEPEIARVLQQLCLDGLDVAEISRRIHNLPTDQYSTTLLSPLHITDPERIHSYRTTLAPDAIAAITRTNRDWLDRYGYPSSDESL